MKTNYSSVFLLTISLLLYSTKCDYFVGLPLNQTLLNNANKAMNSLVQALEKYLDCEDPTPDWPNRPNSPDRSYKSYQHDEQKRSR